jgi:aryl-alcohol dehydrogenase-like predicted oxidoreductase
LSGQNFEKNRAAATPLFRIAKERGVPPSQVAVAWLLRRGEDVIPIPGTKRRAYLEENVAAVHLTLTESEEEQLSIPISVAGERYGPRQLQYLDR